METGVNTSESLEAREQRLALAEAELAQVREQIEAEKEQLVKRGWRDNLYGRINVSVKTMDRVIVGLSVLLLAAVIAGIVL